MKGHRLTVLAATLGCAAMGALAPAAGCNGTGVTPMCDFPDGANNPESGCGELVEAAAMDGMIVEEAAPPIDSAVDSTPEKVDASDATTPPPVDSGKGKDAEGDSSEPADAPHDAPHDAPKDG